MYNLKIFETFGAAENSVADTPTKIPSHRQDRHRTSHLKSSKSSPNQPRFQNCQVPFPGCQDVLVSGHTLL